SQRRRPNLASRLSRERKSNPLPDVRRRLNLHQKLPARGPKGVKRKKKERRAMTKTHKWKERKATMKTEMGGKIRERVVNPAIAGMLCLSVLSAGCATSTRLSSMPEAAKVTLDNRYLGE